MTIVLARQGVGALITAGWMSVSHDEGPIHQSIIQPVLGRRMPWRYEYILVEKESGVAILTMNRPAQLNAMNRQLSAELHDAVTQMVADDEVGCIVITGAGERAFTAGGDIHEQRENDRALHSGGIGCARRRPGPRQL